MKAIFSLVALLLFAVTNAQKFDCTSKTAEYQAFYKAKNMNSAFESWNEVRKNCPKQSETIYTDGIEILQYKTDNAASAEEKETLVREMMKLYDQYNKNFPDAVPDFEVKKAMALYNNKIEAKEEIFGLLHSAFSKVPQSITDANTIFTYFSLCHEKYKTGDSKYGFDFLIDKYSLASGMLTELETTHSDKATEYKTAMRSLKSITRELMTCENLSKYYEGKFEQNKDNAGWLDKALSTLTAKCSANPIYARMAEKLYRIKATANSAEYMALASIKQRKFAETEQYYNEAANLETNPAKKAKIYYILGTGILANDMAKSKENLNKAVQNDPKMGRALLFLAQMYSYAPEKDCGKDDFEKKAIYYLAVKTALKAGEADPGLKAAAQKMADDFKAQALTQADINKAKLAGKDYAIGCWINETITFPAK
ncbi:hypothetical protein [Flavobacterium sedimenticola]|uniref:Tetratricopeptide repeat protein n=1 Tax=Flavobacterium sedimenticola TaxID=3043286 RepID=A0ABT6XN44_9FLAO|nr:hypothetical protein [Flavobacterium sedimenticola]MDI9256511.1 hypothetical protein [Flavobacterium sedimenticola]